MYTVRNLCLIMLKVSGLHKPIYVIPLYSMSLEAVLAPINMKRDSLEMCAETDARLCLGINAIVKIVRDKRRFKQMDKFQQNYLLQVSDFMRIPYVIYELFRACKGKKGPTVTGVLQRYERTSIRQVYILRRFTGVCGLHLR